MLQTEPEAPPPRPAGRGLVGKLLLVLTTWGIAVFVVLGAAATTRIGPVLYTISRRHGVHAGDVVVGTVVFCVALLVTAMIIWPRRDADHRARR